MARSRSKLRRRFKKVRAKGAHMARTIGSYVMLFSLLIAFISSALPIEIRWSALGR